MIRLHTYWRSSSSYRVRIALNLKGLPYESLCVNLVRGGGEQHSRQYRALNPQGLVPTLEHDGDVVTQSLAIIEYIEELFPQAPLLPADPEARARVRSLALLNACEIQPLNNVGTTNFLANTMGLDEGAVLEWRRHWHHLGLAALERRLDTEPQTGEFCHGDRPGLADVCLVPQVYNAQRFGTSLEAFPTIARIDEACRQLEAFRKAAPEAQPDAA